MNANGIPDKCVGKIVQERIAHKLRRFLHSLEHFGWTSRVVFCTLFVLQQELPFKRISKMGAIQ
jgi:hypothetical protein